MTHARRALCLAGLLCLAGAGRAQTIRARSFQRFGPPDKVAAGNVVENLKVAMLGDCAARTIYRNYRGFNFGRQADAQGLHDCQITNTQAGCYTVNLEDRAGWDYYFGGLLDDVPSAATTHYVVDTAFDPNAYPPVLSIADPYYRWGSDCNRPTNVPDRQCSGQVLTGLYNNDAQFDDVDRIRCYRYGERFRVSQEEATVLDVQLRSNPSEHQCPHQQVVTALSDTSHHYHDSVDHAKCNLLLGNWRVNYDDCFTIDPTGRGAGNSGSTADWTVDTPTDQIWGVVALWRVNLQWTGFKSCKLYRIA